MAAKHAVQFRNRACETWWWWNCPF